MENINLPVEFIEEMRDFFVLESKNNSAKTSPESELTQFIDSYKQERSYGLRVNPLKLDEEKDIEKLPFSLRKVNWCREGYFYNPEEQPGKHPLHEMGAYYIQEPSAMEVVELLNPMPGEYVLDMCAAPGGKSTQIAGRLKGKGFLVSNEYIASRAKILAQNLERMGVENCIVLQEDTAKLKERFPVFFHKIVVDAPCSGQGMFRKDPDAIHHWSVEAEHMCAERQLEILDNAAAMLMPGGVLVYSTCTFSVIENEDVIKTFLQKHDEFVADKSVSEVIVTGSGISEGLYPGTLRVFPHRCEGEGHFMARLLKKGSLPQADELTEQKIFSDHASGDSTSKNKKSKSQKSNNSGGKSVIDYDKLFEQFCNEYMDAAYMERLLSQGKLGWQKEHLYLIYDKLPALHGLKVERGGLYLGEALKQRFEPSHTWAMTLRVTDVLNSMELMQPEKYIAGESVSCENIKGWSLVTYQGLPIGWGKASNGILKNHYPKGLRKY